MSLPDKSDRIATSHSSTSSTTSTPRSNVRNLPTAQTGKPQVILVGNWIVFQSLPQRFDHLPERTVSDLFETLRELSVDVRDTLEGGIALDVRIAPQTVLELIDAYRLTATPLVLTQLAEHARDSWMEQALCKQADPEMFYPEKGGATSAAKRICRACPVRQECLNHALDHDERFGIWGGLSERERRKLRPGHTVDAAPAQLPVRRVG